MSQRSADSAEAPPTRRRVHPTVAVTLLETIRSQDLPREILQEEDPTVTMPRRLGLSDAVRQQIGRYREAARKRQRITDEELGSLIRLAIRRPDSQDVFFLAGRSLMGAGQNPLSRLLPAAVGFALSRRRLRRMLKSYFGRNVGGFATGPFTFEGRALPFIQSDPGGDACSLVTGMAQAAVNRYVSDGQVVSHTLCQALGEDICRWDVQQDDRSSGASEQVPRDRDEP